MNERPRTPRPIAWVDGRVLPAADATVPLLDDGVLRGDAVFETILVEAGRTHAREAHLARLRASAKAVGIRVPVVRQLLIDLLAAWGEHDGALKILVTRDGTLRGLLTGRAWPPSIALAPVEVPWGGPLAAVKTTSYALNMWASRQARSEHADDAVVVADGIVHELPTGAICWVSRGTVRTPDPAEVPILDSVTARTLDAITTVERGRFGLEELLTADEVFVVSATRPILPVHAVGETAFPAPGEETTRLRQRLAEHITATLDAAP